MYINVFKCYHGHVFLASPALTVGIAPVCGWLDGGGEGRLPNLFPLVKVWREPRGPGHVQRACGSEQQVRRLLLQAERYQNHVVQRRTHTHTHTSCIYTGLIRAFKVLKSLSYCVCVFIDVSCLCPADYVGNGDFCNGVLMNVLATNRNFSIFYKVSVTAGP